MRISSATWAVLVSVLVFAIPSLTFAASPYARLPRPGDVVRFDPSSAHAPSSWAYADQGWLESFLRLTIDAAISGSNTDNQQSAVSRARQRGVSVQTGTSGLVGEVHLFHYREHDDVEVQVLVKQGSLKNHVYWTTAAELVDGAGRKFLR